MFVLDYEGYKNAEIAEIEGIPIGTVKSRINAAREILKRTMKENEDRCFFEQHRFINVLTDEQKGVIQLLSERYTYEEIAEIEGVPIDAIKSQINEAKNGILNKLNANDSDR